MQLIEELELWYNNRPGTFHPLVDLEITEWTESNFPPIIFTSGAAVFGNQLYHTAMLLLLNVSRVQPSQLFLFQLSRSWHIRRICNISLHNDGPECWDPCLLASFLVAAKEIHQEEQRCEIRHGLAQITKLTGWDVSKSTGWLQ
jgi:hypothetical protein